MTIEDDLRHTEELGYLRNALDFAQAHEMGDGPEYAKVHWKTIIHVLRCEIKRKTI